MNQQEHETESECIGHEPCPSCGSSDNLARYDDGHGYCFGCRYYEHGDGVPQDPSSKKSVANKDLLRGDYEPLIKRKISEETCKKFGYTLGDYKGKKCHIASYRDSEGTLVAQKLRFADKSFVTVGDFKSSTLFGSHLWNSGKKIVITEGEIDALTVSQVQGNKWPTVSLNGGAAAARKCLKNNLEYLNNFQEIILMFDMDEPGQDAAKACADLFPPGKCKIASLPLKDANECLVKGETQAIVNAIWNSKEYRPDGIITVDDVWDKVIDDTVVSSLPSPWPDLDAKTQGFRLSELVTLCAGSGIGKSAVVREIAYHLLTEHKAKVGMLMLEEDPVRTIKGLLGIHLSKPVFMDRSEFSDEDFKKASEEIGLEDRLYMYDHFGSTAIENLMNRIRFLAKGCDCKWIILDHLSIVVSGLDEASGGDERRLIDNTMTQLRTLVQETGIGLILISHLKRPSQGKGHEEGAQTSLNQLRGSHAIAQLSDIVIGLERNQQGDSPNETTIRVLKNRYSGDTGEAGTLAYDKDTGRLSEASSFSNESTMEMEEF